MNSIYPKNHGKEWTIDDMLNLAELYSQPITWNSIAEKMGRTISACQMRMNIIRIACLLAPSLNAEYILESIHTKRKHT